MRPKPKLNNKSYREDTVDNRNKLIFRAKIGFIFGVPILAIVLSIFVVSIFRIKGPSMEPTLHENDRAVINKLDKTIAKATGKQYTPERYDVVVFSEKSSKDKVIKRVVAIPGDHVIIRNNEVLVFNSAYPEGFSLDKALQEEVVIEGITAGYYNGSVPEGTVFVLGDNRERSVDSREFGPILTDDIIGNYSVRIFPFW